jgi:phospholipid/cholesterol/gamma-HCH transport system substrate-binding protein
VIRKLILALIVIVGLVVLASFFAGQVGLHRQTLKACFNDVQGLRSGAEVRIAGVAVGTVGNVRPNPQNKNCPAEIEIRLATSYELQVPNDAPAEIETAGVLGASFVNVDVTEASGTQIENYGYLRSKPSPPEISPGDYVKMLDRIVAAAEASRLCNQEADKKASIVQEPKR